MSWPDNTPNRRWFRPKMDVTAAMALDGIEKSAAALAQTEQYIHAQALDARKAGASWSQIGAALGITKQAAQKRYDRRLF